MNYDLSQFKELEVSFGFTGIVLFSPGDIEAAQTGYSINPNGESLVGSAEGDWKSTWLVIGITEDLGDPIFVDISTDEKSVYTAPNGQGSWNPVLLSNTYENFIIVLGQFSEIAKNRDCPVELENNPMTQNEFDDFIEFVEKTAMISDTYFWGLLISDEDAGIEPEI